MTENDVIALLEQNKNPRGVVHWQNMQQTFGLFSYGIGLTQLRKIAKKIGKNRVLAQTLWQTNIYDAKVISLLIDDPKQITKEQADQQVGQLNGGMLAHVFSSCDATLAKSPLAFELVNEWRETNDDMKRSCAYGLLYELSKNKRNKLLTDEYFFGCLDDIEAKIFDLNETPSMRCSLGAALMGIGKRNKALNERALEIATAVGPIDFNEPGGKCDPFDVVKHLTSDYLKNKFAKS